MIYAINRCVLTAAVAIAETIAFKIVPNTYYSFAIDFTIGKRACALSISQNHPFMMKRHITPHNIVYTNSLLATLNCRESLRGKWGSRNTQQNTSTDADVSVDFDLTSLARGRGLHSSSGTYTRGTLDITPVPHPDALERDPEIVSHSIPI
jgi:hypothetical protein